MIAVPHPKWSERPLAVIVLKPGVQRDRGRHPRLSVASKFVKWMVPDAYVFVDAIPRTSTGKFLKTKLREQYRRLEVGCRLTTVAPEVLSSMNFELTDEQKLIQHTAREFARQEIQPVAAQCDREARFPMEVFDKAREVGLVNMTVPTRVRRQRLGRARPGAGDRGAGLGVHRNRRCARTEFDLRRCVPRGRHDAAEERGLRPAAGWRVRRLRADRAGSGLRRGRHQDARGETAATATC